MNIRKLNEDIDHLLNKDSSFTREQLIKVATILKAIASNTQVLPFNDGALLLKASTLITDNLDDFVAEEDNYKGKF